MQDYDNNTDSYLSWSETDSLYSLLEWNVFLSTIGPVSGLDVLDVACGGGRLSRKLMERGARSVVGIDISAEMLGRAQRANDPAGPGPHFHNLRYEQISACDETFTLEQPVDLVTALYLFHYAPSEQDLGRMCQFIGRNLQPNGRFVTYGINPDYDFANQFPGMEDAFGFRYRIVEPPEYALIMGDFEARMWCWSRRAHEDELARAGFVDVRWHPLELPAEHGHLAPSIQWYLDNPSCIVLEAVKSASA